MSETRSNSGFFEKLISGSRLLSCLAVILAFIGSAVLYIAAVVSVVFVILDLFTDVMNVESLTKNAAVGILKMVDLVLIGIGLQIIGAGIYQLFVNPDYEPKGAMKAGSFSELKATIVKIAGIVLVVDFLEEAVKSGPDLNLLYYGTAIAIVVASMGWTMSMEDRAKKS